MPVLTFDNPALEGTTMPREEVEKNAIVLTSENNIEANRWKSKLNVAFKPVLIGRKDRPMEKVDFKYGCTEAEVSVNLIGLGRYQFYTLPAGELDITRQQSIEMTRGESASIKPAVKVDGAIKAEVAIGEIADNSMVKAIQSTAFQVKEFMLDVVASGKVVTWYIKKPTGAGVLHNYLLGNKELAIEVVLDEMPFKGEFFVRPAVLKYFEGDGAPVKQDFLTRFFLSRKMKGKIDHTNGFTIKFEIHE